jgi:stearoyl-CoA desaturase (delta-9 desaturase)
MPVDSQIQPTQRLAKPAHALGYALVPTALMLTLHLLALAVPFLSPLTWRLALVAVASYYLRMFGITAGYHRYFAHRAFRTSRWFQFGLAFLGGAATQKGAMWWAAHHRDHHRESDKPTDLHSPVQNSFLWSHLGWILDRSSDATEWHNLKDFKAYPELAWLDRWHWLPPACWAAGLYAVGGLDWFLWGYVVSTVVLWHGTFVINSLAHVWGSRRFVTTDASRNNFWLALITLGEGWHNNHHHYQSSARQGFYWWEVDGSYYALVVLSKLGVVWKLKAVPERVLQPQMLEAESGEPAMAQRMQDAQTALVQEANAALAEAAAYSSDLLSAPSGLKR